MWLELAGIVSGRLIMRAQVIRNITPAMFVLVLDLSCLTLPTLGRRLKNLDAILEYTVQVAPTVIAWRTSISELERDHGFCATPSASHPTTKRARVIMCST